MTPSTGAELLIRIAADPSSAETSLSAFRSSVAENLSGVTAGFSRWSASGTAEFGRMQNAALGFSGRTRSSFLSLNQLFLSNRQSSSLWRTALVADMHMVANSSQELQNSMVRGFLVFDAALGRNIATAVIWQKSIGQAFLSAAATAVQAIAQESFVRAIYSAALGFYLLAMRDFAGAAQAFKSAAIFAAVGTAASVAGRALVGAEGGSVGPTAAAGATSQQSAGSPAPATTTKQQSVQVVFQGPVYGGQAGIDELVRHISSAVTERDVNLVAYTVVRQPAKKA